MSFPTLSIGSPSCVTLKLPTGVAAPGVWSASGSRCGVAICAPVPLMMPSGCGLLPLPALPAM